jgi:hypothetical protein
VVSNNVERSTGLQVLSAVFNATAHDGYFFFSVHTLTTYMYTTYQAQRSVIMLLKAMQLKGLYYNIRAAAPKLTFMFHSDSMPLTKPPKEGQGTWIIIITRVDAECVCTDEKQDVGNEQGVWLILKNKNYSPLLPRKFPDGKCGTLHLVFVLYQHENRYDVLSFRSSIVYSIRCCFVF